MPEMNRHRSHPNAFVPGTRETLPHIAVGQSGDMSSARAYGGRTECAGLRRAHAGLRGTGARGWETAPPGSFPCGANAHKAAPGEGIGHNVCDGWAW
ncbi:hypothetical protein JCM13580A_19210 [Streptomyces drozdowiczii]